MERKFKFGDHRDYVPKPDGKETSAKGNDVPVYHCEKMTDKELMKAVLNAGAQTTGGEVDGTK